jgi:UDP-N-acetylmuramate dehydrogenase
MHVRIRNINSEIAMHLRGKLQKNVSLANHTSWRVGGIADTVYQPADLEDLSVFLSQLPQDEPITWLGLGSNTLVRDGGIRGTVLLTFPSLHHLEILADNLVRAEAGVASAQVARFAARNNLTGGEFLAGIPGTIGGALVMNAGCYGSETWSWVKEVETIDRQGNRYCRSFEEYQISYRQAVLRSSEEKPEWFTAATFKLLPGQKEISLQKIREMLDKRNVAQPNNLPNCGSVFRNPPNDFAGRLIEACGLKGFSIGGAGISPKHANFIVNRGNATAADIEALIELIEKTVLEQQKIVLHREVRILGIKKPRD